jgi:flagellar motor switch protein FliN/FliY
VNYVECWISTAAALFSQALAGEPVLVEASAALNQKSASWAATLSGDEEGTCIVTLDAALLDSPLMGEGVDQRQAWGELLREIAEAAAGDLLARSGTKCRVEKFEDIRASGPSAGAISRGFELKFADRDFVIRVAGELHPKAAVPPQPATAAEAVPPRSAPISDNPSSAATISGIELLLDVELEATLRFGCRELPLGEILELGPGDVVPLDRRITDPADLIVGDKIVARGEVVLVNGNFGLRVTEVAAPRKRLESIRCLF